MRRLIRLFCVWLGLVAPTGAAYVVDVASQEVSAGGDEQAGPVKQHPALPPELGITHATAVRQPAPTESLGGSLGGPRPEETFNAILKPTDLQRLS